MKKYIKSSVEYRTPSDCLEELKTIRVNLKRMLSDASTDEAERGIKSAITNVERAIRNLIAM